MADVADRDAFGIPLDGQVVHLDASAAEIGQTVFLDENGGVTNWVSKAGPVSDVPVEFKTAAGINPPRWIANCMNGRPAVYFGTNPDTGEYLWTGLKGPGVDLYHRSVFFVYACSNAAPGYANFYTEYTLGSPNMRINSANNSDPVYGSLKGRARWMVNAGFMPRVDYNGVGDVYYPSDTSTSFSSSGAADFKVDELTLMFCVMRNTSDYSQPFKFRQSLPLCIGQTFRNDHKNWGWRGPFCEILVYDRDLSETEIERVTAALRAKWFAPGRTTTWIGGASGSWETAANWSNGVPGLSGGDVAIVNTEAEITVGQPIELHDFIANASGKLIVNGGRLTLGGSFVVPADYEVEVGGDLALHLDDRSLMQLPKLSATGRVTVTGGGVVKFYGTAVGNPALEVRSGKVDLNGTAQTFSSFAGAVVTNTSATAASLTVAVPDAATGRLFGSFNGSITLYTSGAVEIERALCNSAALRIGRGTVSVSSKLSPSSVPGLTMRLDASDLTSITTNAEGRVIEWRSCLPDGGGLVYGNGYIGATFHRNSTGGDYPVTYPTLVRNVQNGLPAVWFGRNADNEIEVASLVAENQGVSHKTAFCVLVPGGQGMFNPSMDRILAATIPPTAFCSYPTEAAASPITPTIRRPIIPIFSLTANSSGSPERGFRAAGTAPSTPSRPTWRRSTSPIG